MRFLSRGGAWRVGLLLLLLSHASSHDPRGSVSEDSAVKKLLCVSLNLESLKCTWEVPKIANHNYTMFLYNWFHPWDQREKCTCYDDWCDSCPGVCCHWEAPAYDFTSSEIKIELLAETDVYTVLLNHSLIALPNAAENLSIKTTESRQELEVMWNTPKFFHNFEPGLFYSVDYRPKDVRGIGSVDWMKVVGRYFEDNATVGLTSLHGWVEYEVRVRLRSGARPIPDDGDDDDDGWWSSGTSGSAVTPQGAPEVAPAVGVGSFEVESDADPERRAVRLAWRPIPPLLHNGPDLEYHVVVKDETNNVVRNLTEVGSSVEIRNLEKKSSYRMEVSAANRAGVGNQTAEVRVPADPPPAPLLPAVVYHAGTRQFELRWPAKENLTYTAYVCTDGLSSSSPCATNLYWKNVASASAVNLTLEEMNVTDLVAPADLRFALSAETFAEDSSGMAWSSCVHPQQYNYPEGFVPYTRVIDSTTSSVSVHWTASCASRGGVIEEVQAIWCEGHGSCVKGGDDIPKKNESDVFSGALSLEGLREGADYTLNLRFKYRGGFSDWSSAQSFSTKSSALPTWLIVTIVIAASVVTVVVLGASVYSRRKLKMLAHDAQREIVLPEGLGDRNDFFGPESQDESYGIQSQNPSTLTMIDNHDSVHDSVQFKEVLSVHALCFDKEPLRSPFSGGRGLAQDNGEEDNPASSPRTGGVVPVPVSSATRNSPGYNTGHRLDSYAASERKPFAQKQETHEANRGYVQLDFPNYSDDKEGMEDVRCQDVAQNLDSKAESRGYVMLGFPFGSEDTSQNNGLDKIPKGNGQQEGTDGRKPGKKSAPSVLTNEVETHNSDIYKDPREFMDIMKHVKSPTGTVTPPPAGTQTSPGYTSVHHLDSGAEARPQPVARNQESNVETHGSNIYKDPREFMNIMKQKKSTGTVTPPPVDTQTSPGYTSVHHLDSGAEARAQPVVQNQESNVKTHGSNIYKDPREFMNIMKHEKSPTGFVTPPPVDTQTSPGYTSVHHFDSGAEARAQPVARNQESNVETHGSNIYRDPREFMNMMKHKKSPTGFVTPPPAGTRTSPGYSSVHDFDSNAETGRYVMLSFPFASEDDTDSEIPQLSGKEEKSDETSFSRTYGPSIEDKMKKSSAQKTNIPFETQLANPSAGYVPSQLILSFISQSNEPKQMPKCSGTETEKELVSPLLRNEAGAHNSNVHKDPQEFMNRKKHENSPTGAVTSPGIQSSSGYSSTYTVEAESKRKPVTEEQDSKGETRG
ncbi:uncharacterized protein LOC122251552 isoform X2 [Penaeus japonicus]|uniref:uncharacterized protein LOC122251552 isoform X2 n=1 Tax=Penaeus japonicus TaxID=27405 RepID=UPI001C7174B6|nr:uncharacterized protein LOC122251552 isoform X2 [Penaeus japonicus]